MANLYETVFNAGLGFSAPIARALYAFHIDPAAVEPYLRSRGISIQTPIAELVNNLGLGITATFEDVTGAIDRLPAVGTGPAPAAPWPVPTPIPPPGPGGLDLPIPTPSPTPGIGPSPAPNPIPPGTGPPAPIPGQALPGSILATLGQAGLNLQTPLGNTLAAFGIDTDIVRNYLTGRNIPLETPVGTLWSALGLSGNESFEDATARLKSSGQLNLLAGPPTFPQTPQIALPPWQQPTRFPTLPPVKLPTPPPPVQAVPPPMLPAAPTIPPELTNLFGTIQETLAAQQAERDALLASLEEGIQAQQSTAARNQPMLDLALQNIQSVLSGRAASPALEGLVESAFAPAEAEATRRLRQTAEEAAALRGMTLTDTPIGQPYLQEQRRLGETFGGQRAQALMGLRQQDAAFAQQVQQFQEGLKQQALANQMQVIQALGTPEQAAQILSNLGLGAEQAGLGQYVAQGQQALNASDLALRQALGQSAANLQRYAQESQNVLGLGNLGLQRAIARSGASLGAGQFGLASQAQGFQQQLQRQQAGIQNQLALLGALGDPFSAYGGLANVGTGLANRNLQNLLGVSQGLLGQNPNFGNQGFTQTTTGTQPNNTLGNLGVTALGLGSLLGAPIVGGASLGGALWGLLSSI